MPPVEIYYLLILILIWEKINLLTSRDLIFSIVQGVGSSRGLCCRDGGSSRCCFLFPIT